MGNKRVSQLVEMTAQEVVSDDLFLIIDSSAHESKKIEIGNIFSYLNSSGSVLAIHAQLADTASYIQGNNVIGSVTSASYALKSTNSDNSINANTAANAITASYSNTASFALNSNTISLVTGFTYPITSSWANNVKLAVSASYLLNPPTTTISASHANNADLAVTASYYLTTTNHVDSASSAVNSINSIYSQFADTASFLKFSSFNGTASYALSAGNIPSLGFINYGLFPALTQDSQSATIGQLSVLSSLASAQSTLMEAKGTVILNYTSSVYNTGSILFLLTNLISGQTQSLDNTNIYHNLERAGGLWNSTATGSITIPFSLIGETNLYGQYLLQVTSSTKSIIIDPNRTVKFLISSFSDNVTATNGIGTIDFYYFPTSSTNNTSNATFSVVSAPSTTYHDTLTGLLTTGSSQIKTLDISSQSIAFVEFTWKLVNCTDFSCSNNPFISQLNYSWPNTMSYLYTNNCSLIDLGTDLSNTSLKRLDCQNNYLSSLPTLPQSMSYLNCSNNVPLTTFPSLPPQLTVLLSDYNSGITGLVAFPFTILTASFISCSLNGLPLILPDGMKKLVIASNPAIGSLPNTLSLSMSYLDTSATGISSLPSMSISMSYLDISNNPHLGTNDILQCIQQLYNNHTIYSGSLRSLGYGAPTVPIYSALTNLVTAPYSWSISYDSFP